MDTPIHMLTKMKTVPLFCLLQINDSLFPIGGYTQSYGLETYVQKGIVHDADSSARYLESYLFNNFLYNELLSVKLAWQHAKEGDVEALCHLDNLLCAAKAPRELRTASTKLGIRFLKIVQEVLKDYPLFKSFSQCIKSGQCVGHHSVVYGLATNLLGIEKVDALSAFTYSTASAVVNNCAKLIPISQNDGQVILFKSQEIFEKLIYAVEVLTVDSVGICCFGFDLRSMQHERLYTRLYIS